MLFLCCCCTTLSLRTLSGFDCDIYVFQDVSLNNCCLQVAGWWRTGIIYFTSGIGGMAVSTVLLPYQVSVGASCAAFGMFGAMLVDLLQSWTVRYDFTLLSFVDLVDWFSLSFRPGDISSACWC